MNPASNPGANAFVENRTFDVRAAVCDPLAWLGLRRDKTANAAGAACIGTPDGEIDVRVIAIGEQATIARHTQTLLRGARRLTGTIPWPVPSPPAYPASAA